MTQIPVRATRLTLRQATYNAVRGAETPMSPADVLTVVAAEWPRADELDILGLLAWWTKRHYMRRTSDCRYVMIGEVAS